MSPAKGSSKTKNKKPKSVGTTRKKKPPGNDSEIPAVMQTSISATSNSQNADQAVASTSNDQTPADNILDTFIFLSDTDTDTDLQELSFLNGLRKSRSDSLQSSGPSSRNAANVSSVVQNRVAAYMTITSTSPKAKKNGRVKLGRKGRGGRNSANKNPKRKRNKRKSESSDEDEILLSDSESDRSSLLGISPNGKFSAASRRKGTNLKKSRKLSTKYLKKKCDKSNAAEKPNSGSDNWSGSSSDTDSKLKDAKEKKSKKTNKDVTAKPKVRTDWSDDEELASIGILPEAAIFTNRIKDYNEQLKEFRKRKWLTEENLEAELKENVSRPKGKRKGRKKQSCLESDYSDDSEREIVAKIPAVVPKVASDSDEDECPVEVDETITEEHISKTVRNRIQRKIKKLQEEQKRILALPVGYACSSGDDEEEQEIVCLTENEVDSEIIVKIRWQHELVKVPMRMNEPFLKAFNEIAEKDGVKPTDVMLLLRDRTVTLEDTPKSLEVTAGDILDSCIWNARSEVSDVATNMANHVQIMIQSNDSKVKQSFTVHKLEPLLVLMKKYSSERNIPLEKMSFKFDGEKIDPNANAFDLDIEDESCIDVNIL